MIRALAQSAAACVAGIAAGPAWPQAVEYTYVRMSLTVPWTLYFVFLVCVLLPFIVMVALAWRGTPRQAPGQENAAIDETANPAP